MSFSNLGPDTFLAEGQTAFWFYLCNGDRGTVFATADIKPPNQGAVLLASNWRKRLVEGNHACWFVDITNQGPGGVFHNLQGGGLT